ncbi:hypothetical protein [Bacillus sp. V2I10]|uniref:hypothetical protein n=1 Tax=Bacillus sp. V2I10 TaxID=3042276 RepID=UPI002787AEA6|nr:hypothetical protein [Bacillus sp. V2I10]MDQ0857867.1 hypothetical protein [Bacillus sp. V2I10]
MRKTVMLKKAKEGITRAIELDNRLFKTLFQLLIYRIEDKLDQYYSFIERDALPYFQSYNNTMYINKYAKQLYNYNVETEQYEEAVNVSKIFMDTET